MFSTHISKLEIPTHIQTHKFRRFSSGSRLCTTYIGCTACTHSIISGFWSFDGAGDGSGDDPGE